MSTRVASVVGMLVGLAICVGGGILIANPSLGILGGCRADARHDSVFGRLDLGV